LKPELEQKLELIIDEDFNGTGSMCGLTLREFLLGIIRINGNKLDFKPMICGRAYLFFGGGGQGLI
tara:strand:+ start:55 stop:252 length:198 start_codon:yes stop_codon:yes gene_type:complete